MEESSPISFSILKDEKRNTKTVLATVTHNSAVEINWEDAENEQTMFFVKKELERTLWFHIYNYAEARIRELGYPTKYDKIQRVLEEGV